MRSICSLKHVYILLLIAFGFIGLSSCKHKHVTETGFYYWKTTYNPDSMELAYLHETNSKVLYLHYFDIAVGWNEHNFPVIPNAKVEMKDTVPANLQVVPVVFIPNDVMLTLDSNRITELAEKMRRKIDRMSANASIKNISEYQLDCDWTAKTRNNFFALVTAFKKQVSPNRVSVTLRLHQYKYAEKTGIPPADRALLMFYNMGNLGRYDEPGYGTDEKDNYILDLEEAQKYLTGGKTYPLPLDVGLPIYSQGVIFEQGKYHRLAAAFDVEEAIINKWIVPTHGSWYRATGDSTSEWAYRDTAITVRYEQVTPERLKQAAEMLNPIIKNDSCRMVFFHLNAAHCLRFKAHEFNEVVAGF